MKEETHKTPRKVRKSFVIRTMKQRRLPIAIIENKGNVSKAMLQVGYSASSASNPQTVLKSQGFREIANELGLTDSFILDALKEDIEKKPQRRVKELELGAKIKGMLTDSHNTTNKTLIMVISQESHSRFKPQDTTQLDSGQ